MSRGGTAWSVDQTPWDFGHELLPNQLERIAERLDTAFQHFPTLGKAGIKKVVNGPFTFAPDGNALIGPVPGVRNYWAACGVMAGYCQGAGIGKVFADWMIDGEPGMDVFAMDVARFGDFATRRYTLDKVVENFGRRFQISYPNEELPAMRPWRDDSVVRQVEGAGGPSSGRLSGWSTLCGLRPVRRRRMRRRAFAAQTPTLMSGRRCAPCGRGSALSRLPILPSMRFLATGRGIFWTGFWRGVCRRRGVCACCPCCRRAGGWSAICRWRRWRRDRFLIVGSSAAQRAHVRWFERHLPAQGVTVVNRSSRLHGIALAGPQSRELLAPLVRDDFSSAAFPFMSVRRTEVAGVAATVARVSFTGELGYEIYCEGEYQRALYEALMDAGEDFALRPFGGRALMSMRLEKGFGAWGLDFREDFTPLEAGLDRFMDYEKSADFVGKAAAQRQREAGCGRATGRFDGGDGGCGCARR